MGFVVSPPYHKGKDMVYVRVLTIRGGKSWGLYFYHKGRRGIFVIKSVNGAGEHNKKRRRAGRTAERTCKNHIFS